MFMPYQLKKQADFSFDIRLSFFEPAVFVKWIAITGLHHSEVKDWRICSLHLSGKKRLEKEAVPSQFSNWSPLNVKKPKKQYQV